MHRDKPSEKGCFHPGYFGVTKVHNLSVLLFYYGGFIEWINMSYD